jgi:hypothetical protein
MADVSRETTYSGYSSEEIAAADQRQREAELEANAKPVQRNLVGRIMWGLTVIVGGGKTTAPQAEIRTIGPKGNKLPEITPISDSSNKIIQFPGSKNNGA